MLIGYFTNFNFVSQQIVNYHIDFALFVNLYIKTNSDLTSIMFLLKVICFI